jgi:hypothetical protein
MWETYYDLTIDIRAVQKENPFAGDIEIARQLKQGKTRKKYEGYTVSRLRRLVAEALDPAINPIAELTDEDLITFRARWADRELGLPTDIGIAAQRAALEKLVLEDSIRPLLSAQLKGGEPLAPAEWQEFLPNAIELAKVVVEMMQLGRNEVSGPDEA